MHRHYAARLAVILGVCGALAGCGQYAALKAKKEFKDANLLYQQQDYKKAAEHYEAALKEDPSLTVAYFYLANSYDNLYKPARAGEPENDAYMQKAVANYELAVQKETDPKMRKLALEYLVNAYLPEKLNQPEKAEPLIRKMIEMDPNDSTFYFALMKMYEDSGRYDEAEGLLNDVIAKRGNDPAVWMQAFSYYNRQGEFDKSVETLKKRIELEPQNPEAHFFLASVYWEKAFKDVRLSEPQKLQFADEGLRAVDKAISLKPDYMEAVTYRGLLLRVQAQYEKNAARQASLIKEAEAMQAKAIELRKKKAAGTGE